MHLKNTSDRDLHVALLDLTDRLECDVLCQTQTIAAGMEINANEMGGPMKLSLSQRGRSGSGRTHAGLVEDRRERDSVRGQRLRARRGRRAVEIDRDVAEQHARVDRRPNRQPRGHARRPGTVRAGGGRLVRHDGRIGRRGTSRGLKRPRPKGKPDMVMYPTYSRPVEFEVIARTRNFKDMHPTMRERLRGTDGGLGRQGGLGPGRADTATTVAVVPANATPRIRNGTIIWNGERYSRHPGAPAAPPGQLDARARLGCRSWPVISRGWGRTSAGSV